MKIEFEHPNMEEGVLQCKSCGSVVMDSARHLHKEWHNVMEGKINEAKYHGPSVYAADTQKAFPAEVDTADVEYVLSGFGVKLKGQDD
jgi:hypothetical protein